MLTLNARKFLRTLIEVREFTSNDGTLPMLTCVNVEVTPVEITMIGTDRFRILAGTVATVDAGNVDMVGVAEGRFMLGRGEVRDLVRELKARKVENKSSTATVTLTPRYVDGKWSRMLERWEIALDGEVLLDHDCSGDLEFPKWRPFLTGAGRPAEDSAPNDPTVFDDYMTVNMGLMGGREALLIHVPAPAKEIKRGQTNGGMRKPLVSSADDDLDLMGMIMPINTGATPDLMPKARAFCEPNSTSADLLATEFDEDAA